MRDHRSPSSTGARGPGLTRPILPAVAWLAVLAVTVAAAAEPPPARPKAAPVLHLTDDGFVPGALKDSGTPGVLRWQATDFVAPFDFDMNRINAVHYPVPPVPPRPAGDYCFELAGGDLLFGALADLNDTEAVLDVPRLGRLHVKRSHVHRIHRWRDSGDLVYLGPNGLTGWKSVATGEVSTGTKDAVVRGPNALRERVVVHGPNGVIAEVDRELHSRTTGPEAATVSGWREESGQLVSDKDGASIRADLGLPARAAVEFEVSWKGKPDFVLALGVNHDEKASQKAFRFEVWGDDLVVQRETEDEADVAPVGAIHSGPGRAHLCVYLDQERGRIVVASANGKPIADLNVRGRHSPALGGVLLENKRGDVRLERLKITRWGGEAPRLASAEGSRLVRVDGSVADGEVTRYDAGSKEFVVRKGGRQDTRVPGGQVASLFLSTPGETAQRNARVTYLDGARLSGDLVKVDKGALWLTVPGIKDPLGLPVAGMRSLAVLHRDPASASRPGLTGRLEMEGVRLHGRLVDGREQPDSSCLAWQPAGSATASPLRPGSSGRVVYKDPPPPPPRVTQQQMTGMAMRRVAPRPLGGLQGFVSGFAGNRPSPSSQPGRSLHLRTGDVVPSEVTKIDENGVSFRSALSESTFVPHEKVKAVELATALPVTVHLNKTKRERLLMLPRMQKGSPPTHLVRSRNGDYLRGRVTGMDDRTVHVEARLETRDVPRDRVARIIWLHADELDAPKKPAAGPAGRGGATRVQAVCNDGVRLTFTADRLADATLSGTSDVLGKCRVPLAKVDQLLIGGAIEQAAARLVYQQWKLHNAPEPSVGQDDGGPSPNGRAPGTESPLVGKPAPDFTLDLLGGKTFHLSESKGAVVVLDFWATWCGPCIQAMPQVDKVTREFQDQGVRLVAVNLQETPKAITAMLERHKLRLTVALDRDGVVAEKYAANAIPQTVVVGRDGAVARLFVGGGPHLGDQLRDAIKSALASRPKEPAE